MTDTWESRYEWPKHLTGRTVQEFRLDMAEQHFVSMTLDGGEVITLFAEGD